MWKQASRVLTAGNLVVRKDPRMSLRDDYSLELSDITPDDQGAYTCEIDIMGKPISIKHTVNFHSIYKRIFLLAYAKNFNLHFMWLFRASKW